MNLRGMQVDPTPRDVALHIITFDVPIKYISPAALLGLLVNQILVDADYRNGYNNHPNWMHGVVGGLVLGAMLLSLLLFVAYPKFWDVMGVDENQGAQVAYYAVRAASYLLFIAIDTLIHVLFDLRILCMSCVLPPTSLMIDISTHTYCIHAFKHSLWTLLDLPLILLSGVCPFHAFSDVEKRPSLNPSGFKKGCAVLCCVVLSLCACCDCERWLRCRGRPRTPRASMPAQSPCLIKRG